MEERYMLVIDTNKYAGNFEREMTAFITGQVGDCEVGDEIAKKCPKEIADKFELYEVLDSVADEHGCCRPCVIWPTPNRGNDGNGGKELITEENKGKFNYPAYDSVAIFFYKKPTKELIEIVKQKAIEYTKLEKEYDHLKGIKIEGFRLVQKVITYNEECI